MYTYPHSIFSHISQSIFFFHTYHIGTTLFQYRFRYYIVYWFFWLKSCLTWESIFFIPYFSPPFTIVASKQLFFFAPGDMCPPKPCPSYGWSWAMEMHPKMLMEVNGVGWGKSISSHMFTGYTVIFVIFPWTHLISPFHPKSMPNHIIVY